MKELEILADGLYSALSTLLYVPVPTFSTLVSSSASPEIWGQDNLIHMHVRKYALLVMLVSRSVIIRFNYRRFRTWMTGCTAVTSGAETQPCFASTHRLTRTYSGGDEGVFRKVMRRMRVFVVASNHSQTDFSPVPFSDHQVQVSLGSLYT